MEKPLLFLAILTIFIMGFWIPEDRQVPVAGAQPYDWNPAAFWHTVGRQHPQKGINIFANRGTPVVASTGGWVVYRNHSPEGDDSLWVLGSKWRLHHYANLDTVEVRLGNWVRAGEKIGTVGTPNTGRTRPPNLYYAIRSLPPRVAGLDPEKPFWLEQIFYLNPHQFLTEYQKTDR